MVAIVRIDGEGLAELSLSLVVHLLAVVESAAQEVDVQLLVGLGGHGFGLVELIGRLLPRFRRM